MVAQGPRENGRKSSMHYTNGLFVVSISAVRPGACGGAGLYASSGAIGKRDWRISACDELAGLSIKSST
jgi:hypothetical protein